MSERVLVAEDEESLRFVLGAQLKTDGFDVAFAADGREAIERIREHEFPIIVTDMRMPEADGLAVMRAANELWPATEVIVLTAFGSMENVIEALQAGNLFDYLTKPLGDVREVGLAVRRALERRRLQAENVRLEAELSRAFEELRTNSRDLVQAGRLAGVGRMTHTLARGINNPLEHVLNLVSYLNGRLGAANWEELSADDRRRMLEGLRRVDDAARRSRHLVEAVLRYTEADDGSFETVEVNGVVRDALTLTETESVEAGVMVDADLHPDAPPVLGSPLRIQQVLTSLLLRALEGTERGGSIRIATGRKEGKPPSAVIEIEAGVSGDLDHSDPELTVTRSIIEEHRGQMVIEERDGGRARTVLILPALGMERKPTLTERAA